jgi:hypothetical protein
MAMVRRMTEKHELKPARSQAELIRVWQGWVLIVFACASWLTNLLVALKVFDIL